MKQMNATRKLTFVGEIKSKACNMCTSLQKKMKSSKKTQFLTNYDRNGARLRIHVRTHTHTAPSPNYSGQGSVGTRWSSEMLLLHGNDRLQEEKFAQEIFQKFEFNW